jgi:hypothetical protein
MDTTRVLRLGSVCKLSDDQSSIIDVYVNLAAACAANGFKSKSSLTRALKGGKSGGYYWRMWNECIAEMQRNYEANTQLRHGGPNPLVAKRPCMAAALPSPMSKASQPRLTSFADQRCGT